VQESDETLVERTLAGETQAFGVLVGRYQRQVYSLMRRLAGASDESADLAQDVFVRAYERLASFRAGARFFPWLYAIALNRARDWARRRRPEQLAAADTDLESLPGPGDDDPALAAGRGDLAQMVGKALERLPLESREMLLLRYREEMPMREIAAVFGISEAAVKMRLGRGLAALRRVLGEDGHGPAA
jgi:RNA polymerase sigma-70 factor (ECF subfamily)